MKTSYYCRHCGHSTRHSQWPSLYNYRCPNCQSSTKPKQTKKDFS